MRCAPGRLCRVNASLGAYVASAVVVARLSVTGVGGGAGQSSATNRTVSSLVPEVPGETSSAEAGTARPPTDTTRLTVASTAVRSPGRSMGVPSACRVAGLSRDGVPNQEGWTEAASATATHQRPARLTWSAWSAATPTVSVHASQASPNSPR